MDEALSRVSGAQLAQLMFPQFDAGSASAKLLTGHVGLARRGRGQGGVRLATAR